MLHANERLLLVQGCCLHTFLDPIHVISVHHKCDLQLCTLELGSCNGMIAITNLSDAAADGLCQRSSIGYW